MGHDAKDRLFQMMRIRMVEETIAEHYSEQEMRCPVHLSIGQEAVAVGVCLALQKTDYLMSTHRAHAHYLAKGGDLKAMIAEIYGKATGCCSGRGGSMHLVDLGVGMLGSTPIVGSSLPVAVGTSFASWLKGEKRATVSFMGEGSTEEGVFSECLNFAALKELPMIFICENNLYSVYSPLSVRQPKGRDLIGIARAHGLSAASGNGNDVDQVFHMTQEAVMRAKEGKGPTLLEFSTYRWREHCGPNYDNDIGYRTEEEFQSWKKQCPIDNYQNKLLKTKIVGRDEIEEMRGEIKAEIKEAFAFAKSSPFPHEDQLAAGVYATLANQ